MKIALWATSEGLAGHGLSTTGIRDCCNSSLCSLIDHFGRTVHKLTNKSRVSLKKFRNIVLFSIENSTNYFDIPTTMLTTVSKNKDKITFNFLLSDYMRKHDTVSSNSNQRTLLPKLKDSGMEIKIHSCNNSV